MEYQHWLALGRSVQDPQKDSDEEFLDVVEVAFAYAQEICLLISFLTLLGLDRADTMRLVDTSMAKFMEDLGYEEAAFEALEAMDEVFEL